MSSKIQSGAQNLNDLFNDLIANQKGISPKEEAEFVAKYLPNQNKKVRFVNTSRWLRFFWIIVFVSIVVAFVAK